MSLELILGIIASALHLLAYILYNREAKLGNNKPNFTSWFIFAFLAGLNACTFTGVNGNWIKALQFIVGSVASVATFFYILSIGKFSRPSRQETFILFIGIIAAIVWWFYRDAEKANLLVLMGFLIGFIPTLEGVANDPKKERPGPWVAWSLALIVTTVNVALSWNGSIASIATPLLLFLGHALVAVLSLRKQPNL